jgi:hypothetical protein
MHSRQRLQGIVGFVRIRCARDNRTRGAVMHDEMGADRRTDGRSFR